MLEFRLLGPVEMSSAGVDYPVEGAIQKGLLVSLLVSADRTVSADELRTELWGACWAGSSENALHAHVSRLRRQLKRAEPAVPLPRLQAVRSGYRLMVEDEQVDAARFVATVEELRRSAAQMPPAQLVERLRGQLAVWRGPAFGGLVGGPICEGGARAYEEARQEAQALLFDAELRCGHHPRILAELRAEVEEYSPYLERFTERLMVALYRCGRQVEALQAYQRTVRCLASHAQSPSIRLRKVHQAVLNHAPALDGLLATAAV
ncbi:MAG TPA: AfsR/SARP family transcriptional regulator [Actinocrinis sp.]|jgi:DNA-binding SARP family transcriptional activator